MEDHLKLYIRTLNVAPDNQKNTQPNLPVANKNLILSLLKHQDYFAQKDVHFDGTKWTDTLIFQIRRITIYLFDICGNPIPPEVSNRYGEYLYKVITAFNENIGDKLTRDISRNLAKLVEGSLPDFQADGLMKFIEKLLDDFIDADLEIILFSEHCRKRQLLYTNVELAVISDKFTNLSQRDRINWCRERLPDENPWIKVVGITKVEYQSNVTNALMEKIRAGIKLNQAD